MPKPTKGARLASGPAHQRHLIRGLAASLILEERIRTSEAKARLLRPHAEKLVTLGKAGTLHARRQALRVVEDADVVHKLFAEIAPRFAEREGGYIRILKLGPRKGDGAPMAILEFVEEAVGTPGTAAETTTRRRVLRRRKKGSTPSNTPPPPSPEISGEPAESPGEPAASVRAGPAPDEPDGSRRGDEGPPQ